jgi:hypothetical protein
LLEVELASLPRDSPEDRFARRGHTRVVIAMKVTPQRPRWTRLWKKERQCASASLRATLTPKMVRWPEAVIPSARRTAQSRSWPSWRTFS